MRLDPHFGMLPVGAFEHCGDRRIRLHGGGGIPIVSDVFEIAEDIAGGAADIVDDAVSTVGDVVEDVGDFVGDTVDKAATAIDNTVTAALDDPVNTAIRAAALYVGGPAGLAAANAAISVGQGQSLEDAALTAGKSFALAQAGSAIGAEAGAFAGESGLSPEMARVASGAASGATKAGLGGGDPFAGAISGGVNTGLGMAAKSISDQAFENWSREQAANAYENSYSPTEQDVLAADPSIPMDFPLSTPTDATGSGYYDEESGAFVPDELGGLTEPLTDASGTNLGSMDGYTTDNGVTTMPDGTTADLSYLPESTQSPLDTAAALPPPTEPSPEGYNPPATTGQIKSGLGMVANNLLNQSGTGTSAGAGMATAAPQQTNAPLTAIDFTPKFLDTNPRFLETKVVSGSQPKMQELRQLYESMTPELAATMSGRGYETPQYMAGGGSADSSFDINNFADSLNPSSKNLGFVKPYASNLLPAAPLMQNQMKLNPLRHLHESLISRQRTAGGLANGGLPQKYAQALPAGHKPEFITGLTGYYASGKGTGQSDDIDAMLHDGDYVADADLVAALGDGSSKAGAEALEKFRRQIPHQEHAQGGAAVAAKIADGEYVFPAAFVSAIGGGDNKSGAKILDKMREAIRAHKRSAPTTKIPPKAKSPLDYLKMVKG